MTITTHHVPAHAWLARKAAEALWDTDDLTAPTPHPASHSAVLTITGLPVRLRRVIERALVICLRSDLPPAPAGTDPLTADFFTRWTRDSAPTDSAATDAAAPAGGATVRCRQVVTGTEAELKALRRVLGELAADNGFRAQLERVDTPR